SSSSLWKDALKERRTSLGWSRLLTNLSLLALVAFALLSVFALAQISWLASGGSRNDIVALIDTSASMQATDADKSRFDRGVAEIRRLVDELGSGSRMLIMTSARQAELRSSFESDREQLLRVIDTLDATDETGDIASAVELAVSLLRDRERGNVYVITDRAFDADIDAAGANVEIIDVGGSASNVAITRFDIRAEYGREDRYQVLLTVHNFTPAVVTVPVGVSLNGRVLIEQKLTIQPDDKQTVVSRFSGVAQGRARALAAFEDALQSDNFAYAVLQPGHTRLVALFSKGNFYLEGVLAALPNTLVTRIDALDPDAFAQHAQWNDLVVVDGMDAPTLTQGNYLLVNAHSDSLPVMARGVVLNQSVSGQGASALIRDIDFQGVTVDRARKVELPSTFRGQPLFWSDETPLGFGLLNEEYQVVWLGFDPGQSNLPLKAAYPLFVSNVVEWLAPIPSTLAPTQIMAGESYLARVSTHLQSVVVQKPSGVTLEVPAKNGDATIRTTSRSGIYSVSANGEKAYFAVNQTNAGESRLTPRAVMRSSAAEAPLLAEESQRGTPLWPYLVLAALAVLIVEWLAFGARRVHA
ncbi:MAG: VWA domain-containing protein, partial [Chromatiales bacterium]|nr:VWA domain-containing protein [Chromatiales bacterium]